MNKAAPSLQTKSDSLGSNIIVGPMATVSNETAVALTNRSPAHIMLLDSNNKIADVSERCERLLEQSAAELRGTLDLSRFDSGSATHLSGLLFEGQGAFTSQS